MEKKKGGWKTVFKRRRLVNVVISSEENIHLFFRNLIAEFDKR